MLTFKYEPSIFLSLSLSLPVGHEYVNNSTCIKQIYQCMYIVYITRIHNTENIHMRNKCPTIFHHFFFPIFSRCHVVDVTWDSLTVHTKQLGACTSSAKRFSPQVIPSRRRRGSHAISVGVFLVSGVMNLTCGQGWDINWTSVTELSNHRGSNTNIVGNVYIYIIPLLPFYGDQ